MQKRFFRPKPEKKPLARINEQIRVPEVRVIGTDGKQLGVMPTSEAISLAREQDLDLVEISPVAQPPVAKIINYDKYRYQQDKAAQAQKKRQKKIDVKGIRISVRTGQHDLEFKAKKADEFLKDGDKVKIDMMLRGREKANHDYAMGQMDKFLTFVTQPHNIESRPSRQGGIISTTIAPKN